MLRVLCAGLITAIVISGCTPLAVGAGAAGGVIVGKEMSD